LAELRDQKETKFEDMFTISLSLLLYKDFTKITSLRFYTTQNFWMLHETAPVPHLRSSYGHHVGITADTELGFFGRVASNSILPMPSFMKNASFG
jgi:hypothetical protein